MTSRLQSIIKGSQGGISRKEWKRRPQKNAVHWLGPSALFSHLSYTAQAPLTREGAAYSGHGPPTSLTINKMPLRHGHKPIWWRYFLL